MSRFIDSLRVDAPRPFWRRSFDANYARQTIAAARRTALPGVPDLDELEAQVEQTAKDVAQARRRWPPYDGELLRLLRTATAIVADDVIGLDIDLSTEIPIAPPFDNLWIEARLAHSHIQAVGWHLVTHDLHQPQERERIQHMVAGGDPLGPESRWAVNVSWFVRKDGVNEGPMDTWLIDIDEDGRACGAWRMTGADFENLAQEPGTIFWRVLFQTLALMNCRNVELQSVTPPPKLSHAHERRHGQPLVRYRVLDVEPFKATVRNLEAQGHSGRQQALHLIRGHFKTYTAERPLFGRVTGTWYWPAHAAGTVTAGRVDKDYRVKATVG